MKLKDIISIKIDNPNADFWIIRRGSSSQVGKPSREYSKEAYGVTITHPDILTEYLFYLMQYVHSTGYYKGSGVTRLVNIKASDILDLELA